MGHHRRSGTVGVWERGGRVSPGRWRGQDGERGRREARGAIALASRNVWDPLAKEMPGPSQNADEGVHPLTPWVLAGGLWEPPGSDRLRTAELFRGRGGGFSREPLCMGKNPEEEEEVV